MNEMKFKSVTVKGHEVLLVKWQDDREQPAIRLMAFINNVYAQSDIGFDDFDKRDRCYDNMPEKAASMIVDLLTDADEEQS